jgi:NAD(P)-dependent dehydrogenase (short-subunit alcohol dehydrogenase family)
MANLDMQGLDLARWMRLDGRSAVVTGAGAGIGRAIAHMLASQGAAVALLDRDAAAASREAAAITANGGVAQACACDIAVETEVIRAVAEARVALGGVDIVVNSAGIASAPGMPFTNNTEADWDRTLAVNVKGAFFVCKAAVGALQQSKHGRIVNISSITGVISLPYMPPYSVSKAALISFTKVLARDLAAKAIAVNAICPGYVWTPLWEKLGPDMAVAGSGQEDAKNGSGSGSHGTVEGNAAREVFEARIKQHVPMGRPQSAEEVAALAAFLCSNAGANITGQVIGVDGGVTI